MRARFAVVAAAAALALTAVPSHAAGAPQITDPTGDGAIPLASMDIVSGMFSTTGTTAKVKVKGKTKTVYTPKQLEVVVTYAAAPETTPGASQYVAFDVAGCGEILLQLYYAGGTWTTSGCAESNTTAFSVVAEGNALHFSLPFSSVGSFMKKGTAVTHLRAWTGGADPATGTGPSDLDETFVNDTASTDAAYNIA